MSTRLRSAPRPILIVSASVVAALVPLCFLGAGTDLDAGSVLYSGSRIVHGDYVASRAPGSPVHEMLAGVIDLVAGVWAVNLLSLGAAVALGAALWALLAREGVPAPWLAVAFVVASPWFQIAATSVVDFVLASALVTAAALTLRRGSPVLAGLLGGLAVGTRMSTVLFVVAMAVAELTGRAARPAGTSVTTVDDSLHRRRDRVVRFLVVAGIVAVVAFVPPFVAAGESLAFARNDFATGSPANHVGRAFAKNVAYLGPYATIALVAALPALWALRRRWSESWTVRFAAVGFVLGELLFVRFPWKVGHLIGPMVCLALLLAEALRARPRLFAVIVVAQLALGVVNIEVVRPDVGNAASGATFELRVRPGPLVVDVQCRLEDRDAARSLDVGRMEAVWNCARPWGDGP